MRSDVTPPSRSGDDLDDAIKAAVRARVSAARYEHILAVADLAERLAPHWGIAAERARRAALLHDYARDMTEPELLRAAEELDLAIGNFERAHPGMLHGPVAARVARRDWGVDPAAAAAIAGHTTGHEGMETFELLLFVADHVAEGRRGDRLPAWRDQARHDLVGVAREVMDDLIKRSIKREYTIAPSLVEARNDLLSRQRAAVVYSREPNASDDRASH